MKKNQFPVPTREDRDLILNVVYVGDPRPPTCQLPGHADPKTNKAECEPCRAFHLWRQRMYGRFHRRGLRLTLDDRDYDDPEPPRCPLGHAFTSANHKACDHCKARHNWLERRRIKLRSEGVALMFSDWDVLLPHLRRLREGGMTPHDIARAASCGADAVERLLRGVTTKRAIRADFARRLLDIPVPGRSLRLVPNARGVLRLDRVDATGTRRRVQAACRAGHSIAAQSRRLGWSAATMRSWLTAAAVHVDIVDAVAILFPTLISQPGGDTAAAEIAASKGWVEARYFSATNIDDPAYDPFAIVDNPVGLHRRLRALAWMGHGPGEVAAFTGEDPEQVEVWLKGGPALAYATHLVDAAFEALVGDFGPDSEVREHAIRLDWAPPLAWHDIDIDDPDAQPCYSLPPGESETDHPLESQVLQALIGRIGAAEMLKTEKARAVRILHNAGWSDRRIAAWLRWNPDGDIDKGKDAVSAWRRREGIVGGGPASIGLGKDDAEEGRIVTPAAA
jgi:hypothetical protein